MVSGGADVVPVMAAVAAVELVAAVVDETASVALGVVIGVPFIAVSTEALHPVNNPSVASDTGTFKPVHNPLMVVVRQTATG